jgi:hypothetical protein
MARNFPPGWSSGAVVDSTSGTDITELVNLDKSQETYKKTIKSSGKNIIIASQPDGSYAVFYNQVSFNNFLYSVDTKGTKSTGSAYSNQNTKTQLGGNAGLKDVSQKVTKELQELTKTASPEEQKKIENVELKVETQQTPEVDNTDLSINDFEFDVTAEDFEAGKEYAYGRDNLVYPETINSSQDRIFIKQKRYIPSATTLDAKIFTDVSVNTKEVILGTVVLPIPNNLTESNATGWGENSLSTLAGLVMNAALPAVKNLAEGNLVNSANVVGQKAEAILKSNDVQSRMKTALTLNAAAAVTKMFGINVDPEAFRSRATGTVINPNLELLFNGPKLRSFGFEFKMSPRSKTEAKNIRQIIKFFKKGMAAVRKSSEGEKFYLGAPNVFDIEFKSGNTKLNSIGKIKTCALQQFNVNYTPEGFYAAYQDSEAGGSQPISVTIQLSFTELTPMYNDDYEPENDPSSGVN